MDVASANFSINGKKFDINNNVDLEDLSKLSNYSLEEVLTGRQWVNGKPIYRKVILYTTGAPAPTTNILLQTGLTDLAWVSEFKLIDSSYVSSESKSYYTSAAKVKRILSTKDGSEVTIKLSNSNSGWVNSTYFIIMEYTKTV
jgi:hypothetical protein